MPEISGFYFSPLRGVEECLRGKGYDLLVQSAVSTPDDHEISTIKLGEHNTDGLLVFAASLNDAEITRLYRREFPMVLLHQSSPQCLEIPCVTMENKVGALRIVHYLIESHAYKRIALLAGPDTEEDAYWRGPGDREALESHGIPFDPDIVFTWHFDTNVAQASVTEKLKKGSPSMRFFPGMIVVPRVQSLRSSMPVGVFLKILL